LKPKTKEELKSFTKSLKISLMAWKMTLYLHFWQRKALETSTFNSDSTVKTGSSLKPLIFNAFVSKQLDDRTEYFWVNDLP